MSNSASWWANKLGQQPQPRYGIPVIPTQPQPVHVPVQQPVQQQPPPAHDPNLLDPTQDRNAEISMGDALRLWKGGEAHRREGHMECPSCGSKTGYTAYSGAGNAQINGQRPRPHCFECGYNGSYTQGLQANWA